MSRMQNIPGRVLASDKPIVVRFWQNIANTELSDGEKFRQWCTEDQLDRDCINGCDAKIWRILDELTVCVMHF